MTGTAPVFYAFWSINAPLDELELMQQLERLRDAGLDGVVFHPRFYPGDPPYLSSAFLRTVSRVILHARKIGMSFWLYDENGWPSGTVGGALASRHPEARQQWVGLWRAPQDDTVLAFSHGDHNWWAGRVRGPGVDYLGPHLASRFQELTYERYRDGLDPEAWEHVEGFFCDEPEFGLGHAHSELPPQGAIPWTPDLPDLYRARCDGDLHEDLPALFFDLPRSGEVRIRFWELLTDLFIERFVAPMNAWAARHGKTFAAHMKGEETPLFQVPLFGSGSRVLPSLSRPAIDALERFPATDYHPRQVSTAARQWGSGRAMVEAWGGSGWGGTPGDLERFLVWLSDHGLTDFVMHISQYQLSSAAQDDWPPSQPLHLTWREAYPAVLDAVRQHARDAPRPPADTLVVAPVRAVMAAFRPWELVETNVHDGGRHPLSSAAALSDAFMDRLGELVAGGVRFDVVDERTAEVARVDAESVSVGRARYRRVVVDPGCELATDAARALAPFEGSARRDRVDARAASPRPHETREVVWRIASAPMNAFPLEPLAVEGWFEAAVDVPDVTETRIVFSDRVAALEVNGQPVEPEHGHDGSSAPLGPGRARIRFRPVEHVRSPRVRVEGFFSVSSAGAWAADGEMLVTDGGWALAAPRYAVDDLVTDGYPFLRDPLQIETDVATAVSSRLRFERTDADALGVEIDGHWCGWVWERDGEHVLSRVVAAGAHRIRLLLIPNGYNAHGPHHYVYGDAPLISPDQIAGRRGFADPPGAPAVTHDDAWRFRRTRVPAAISVLAGAP